MGRRDAGAAPSEPSGAAASGSPLARLIHRADFEAVYRSGLRRSSAQFVLFYRAAPGTRGRFGVSVKKALGGAVVRNRMRRRIGEILRRNSSEIPSGWDFVIHPRRSVAQANFSALRTELLTLMRVRAQAS